MFDARIRYVCQSTAIVLFLALRSRRRSTGAPFSLQSKQLQPDHVRYEKSSKKMRSIDYDRNELNEEN